MAKLLWEPSEERKRNANITKFMEFVNQRYGKSLRTYEELYTWSVRVLFLSFTAQCGTSWGSKRPRATTKS